MRRLPIDTEVDQDMAPIAIVEHRLPGRARLRIPSKRGEIPWFASLVRQLARHPEIDELRANPRTGSILIHHQDPLDLLELLATESSLIEIAASSPEHVHQDVPQTGALAPVSGLLSTTAAGLGALAVYQATRGRAVGNRSRTLLERIRLSQDPREPDPGRGFCRIGSLSADERTADGTCRLPGLLCPHHPPYR